MRTDTTHTLKLVRATGDDWQRAVREQLQSGRNFFLILPDDPEAIARFCKSFELKSDCVPDNFTRSDLIRMGQYIDGAAFDEMLAAWNASERVIFVEQLDFPSNRPPQVK